MITYHKTLLLGQTNQFIREKNRIKSVHHLFSVISESDMVGTMCTHTVVWFSCFCDEERICRNDILFHECQQHFITVWQRRSDVNLSASDLKVFQLGKLVCFQILNWRFHMKLLNEWWRAGGLSTFFFSVQRHLRT